MEFQKPARVKTQTRPTHDTLYRRSRELRMEAAVRETAAEVLEMFAEVERARNIE